MSDVESGKTSAGSSLRVTPEPDNSALSLLLVLVVWGSMFSWLLVTDRWRRGLPMVAYVPRRQVPWNGAAVGLLLAVFLVSQAVSVRLARRWFEPAQMSVTDSTAHDVQGPDEASASKPDVTRPGGHGAAAHPLVRFLAAQRGKLWAIWLAAAVGVVMAPLVEELLFRVLLQGWLESRESRWRRAWSPLRRLPRGVVPVVMPALVFASLHFRSGPPPDETESLGPVLVANALGSLVTLVVAVVVLRMGFGATLSDAGLNGRPWLKDIGRGTIAFAALLAPIYIVQLALTKLLAPWEIAADPFALFLLAMALGYLYYRTHRLLPPLTLHVCINLFGLIATWLATQNMPGVQ